MYSTLAAGKVRRLAEEVRSRMKGPSQGETNKFRAMGKMGRMVPYFLSLK